jgi:hypothetical protein
MLNIPGLGEDAAGRVVGPLVALAVLAGSAIAPAWGADLSSKTSTKPAATVATPASKSAAGRVMARRAVPRRHSYWRVAALQPRPALGCRFLGLCPQSYALILGVGF